MAPREIWQRDRAAAIQYQHCAVPYLLGPWAPHVVEAPGPGPGERALDVACGTGVVARMAAQVVGRAGRVTGIDLNPDMLAVAKTVPQGAGTPVHWCRGDAVALPFRDGAFDLAFCQQGLQFFPDRPAAAREIIRVLVPEGRLSVAVWQGIERCPYFSALAAAVGLHLGDEAARQMRSSFALGDVDELRSLLSEAGFRSVQIRQLSKAVELPPLERFIPEHLAGTSLAAEFAALDAGTRARMISDVSAALLSGESRDAPTLSFAIHLAIAMKPSADAHAGRGGAPVACPR